MELSGNENPGMCDVYQCTRYCENRALVKFNANLICRYPHYVTFSLLIEVNNQKATVPTLFQTSPDLLPQYSNIFVYQSANFLCYFKIPVIKI